jgi:hypothetical protein
MMRALLVVALLLPVGRVRSEPAAFPFDNLLGHSQTVAMLLPVPLPQVSAALSAYDADLCLARETPYVDVMLMSNWMTKLHTVPFQVSYFSSNYNEFIVGLGGVVLCDNRTGPQYSTSLTLYLNNKMAVLGGRLFYGLPKKLERIKSTGSDHLQNVTVHSELADDFMLTIASSIDNSSWTLDRALQQPGFPEMRAFLDATMIQPADISGHYCFTMAFNWTSPDTVFQGASLVGSFAQGAVPAVPAFQRKWDGSKNILSWQADWIMSAPLTKC